MSSRGMKMIIRETMILVKMVPVTHMATATLAATSRLPANTLKHITSTLIRLTEK